MSTQAGRGVWGCQPFTVSQRKGRKLDMDSPDERRLGLNARVTEIQDQREIAVVDGNAGDIDDARDALLVEGHQMVRRHTATPSIDIQQPVDTSTMSAPSARHWEQNKEATVYVGNLHERITPRILHELMLNAGRVRNVNMPVDRVNGQHQGFGFVEFHTEDEAEYAPKVMNQVALYGSRIRVNKASADKQRNVDIGAELFIGNLDAAVDERTLYDTFGQFGPLLNVPKIAKEDQNMGNMSKGYGFVSYGDFESADQAIASMHNQYVMNKQITVQYAYKKDGKGERHGDEAERMLAKQAKAHGVATAVQPLPAHLFQLPQGAAPTGPAMDGRGVPGAPSGPSGVYGAPSGPPGFAPNGHSAYGRPHNTASAENLSLPPPPSGLPARPPSGTPSNFFPPPPGYGNAATPAFGGPPPGFAPPGYAHGLR
ncbi:RNA-binding domain-containing protein [Clathrospora elynae]|uniref:RNA-binding domain-containing protein n=1 Tax=Clathrospora elynae TaxID=706981 RepID=A0A6A5SN24_9PLEO|nr:RNA-binding domain-containing protein [Clathrospora elynae]